MREIELAAATLSVEGITVDTVYFGGGTASVLSADQVRRLLAAVSSTFEVARDVELTFEGECLTLKRAGFLPALADMGFDRLSFGVQTMDSGAREVLNLRPTVDELADVASRAAPLFGDVCVDFIFGWPGQTPEMLAGEVAALVSLIEPLSVEVFQFDRLDGSPAFMRSLYAAGLRDPSTPWNSKRSATLSFARSSRTATGAAATQLSADAAAPRARATRKISRSASTTATSWASAAGPISFLRGAMWSFGLPQAQHDRFVSAGRLPVARSAPTPPGSARP